MGIFSGALRLPRCNYSMITNLKRGKMEPGCMCTVGLELSLRPPSPEVVSVRALVLVLGLLLPEGAFSILIHMYFLLVKEVSLCGLLSLEFELTERQRLDLIHCCIPSSLIVSDAHLFLSKCILINEWTNTAFIKVLVFLYSKFTTLLWWFTGLSILKPPYL